MMQETSMADAIATSHQNDFDAIALLYLSILMQETMMVDAIATHASTTTNRCEKAIASRSLASARIKCEINVIRSYCLSFGPITSKICRWNRVKN
jgi:hypothetical protein